MRKQNYEVEILVNGHAVKEYSKDQSVYVEARTGNTFSIRIKNNGYKRILAVPSVDGLSVMNGDKASHKSGGYIVDGYDSIVIDGWRTSDKEVSEFYFTNPENSYAERTDKGGNVGVIGVAIFREKEYQNFNYTVIKNYPYQYPIVTCSSLSATSINTNLCATAASGTRGVSQDVGTGFGDSKLSSVTSVSFDKEENPDAVFEIYYNTRKNLERLGIDFKKVQYVAPQAFPNQYCKVPRN